MPPEGPIEPVVEDGVVRNTAGTILGADNKAAVAAMIEGARRVLEEGRSHAGLELVFTAKEEVGLRGAYAFDRSRLHAELGYVYDQAAPIGEIILGAPSSVALEVIFEGRCRPRRALRRRKGVLRSPPPRARSPTCGSAGSTPRRARTSA